jgi:hypothetical protein
MIKERERGIERERRRIGRKMKKKEGKTCQRSTVFI